MRLPIQVEALVFRQNGQKTEYLLLKRLPERNGFWQPVTGGLEEGETRMQALYREIREETGVKNIIRVIEDLYYFEFSDPNFNREYVYGVEVSSSEDIVLDGHEHSEYRWCSYREALVLLTWKENKQALKRLDRILHEHTQGPPGAYREGDVADLSEKRCRFSSAFSCTASALCGCPSPKRGTWQPRRSSPSVCSQVLKAC
jgi:dATP pyrophosphohydrolase